MRWFFLMIMCSVAAPFSVTIIYPDRSENTFVGVAHQGAKAFQSMIPSATVVMKKRYYTPLNMCSSLSELVNNVVRTSPKVYIFVIRPNSNAELCQGKWDFSERLILSLPKTLIASTELTFDLVNGKKYFVGTWKEMVEMINEQPDAFEAMNITSNETRSPSNIFKIMKEKPTIKEAQRKRRLVVLGLVILSAALLAVFICLRGRHNRKQLDKVERECVIEAETSA